MCLIEITNQERKKLKDKHMFEQRKELTCSRTIFCINSSCTCARRKRLQTFMHSFFFFFNFLLPHPYFGFYNSLLFLHNTRENSNGRNQQVITSIYSWRERKKNCFKDLIQAYNLFDTLLLFSLPSTILDSIIRCFTKRASYIG